MATTKIICLANSKKLNHRCFAGKEFQPGDTIGKWIRPTDTLNKDSVTVATMSGNNGQLPKLLDIVAVPLTYLKISHHQRENWLFDTAVPWKVLGEFPKERIGTLIDSPANLWGGDSSSKGKNDRVPTTIAHSNTTQSLYLINATDIILSRKLGYDQKSEFRALFNYSGTPYDLGNTDLIAQEGLTSMSAPQQITAAKGILCVSLTEDFKGYCYKLVAGVFL